jgi:hypothetical protein
MNHKMLTGVWKTYPGPSRLRNIRCLVGFWPPQYGHRSQAISTAVNAQISAGKIDVKKTMGVRKQKLKVAVQWGVSQYDTGKRVPVVALDGITPIRRLQLFRGIRKYCI